MKSLYIKKVSCIVALMTIIMVVFASVAIASFYVGGEEGTTNLGTYTFDRTMVIEGETVYFYESGDTSYHYSHDSDGFILIRDEDSLTYATNVNGVPVSSGVSYTASSYAISRVDKMTVEEIDFVNNSYLYMDSEYDTETSEGSTLDLSNLGVTNVNDDADKVYNICIYIAFADDDVSEIAYLQTNPLEDALNGSSGSMASYYSEVTYGGLEVISVFPYQDANDTIVYVYQDSQNRSYYNVSSTSTTTRVQKERELLTAAVNAAATYFDFSDVTLDADNDGYVDSIGFLISGSDSDDWGNLLWPHSWSFSGFGSTDTKLGGVTCETFLFSFCNDVQVSTLSHEFFHVLGAPDLYHYHDGTCYDIPVGYWDLMGSNYSTPQYSLTHIRQKYLGYIEDTQVVEIDSSGVYQLDAVQTVDTSGVLAFKIATDDPNQYIWMEYRSNELGGWDSVLDGSGLIVYRVDSTASEGNRNGEDNSSSAVNEVYIFRPDINFSEYNDYGDGLYSLKYAYLSTDNPYFSSLGMAKTTYSTTYNHNCIYKSDGTNTGIVIEIVQRTSSTIEFVVKLDGKDFVDEDYFVDFVDVESAEYYIDDFSGIKLGLNLAEANINYLASIEIKLFAEGGNELGTLTSNMTALRAAYNSGERYFDANFIVNDNGNTFETVFDGSYLVTSTLEPSYVQIYLTDADGATGMVVQCSIDTNGISWEFIKTSELQYGAALSTTELATFATKENGDVVASSTKLDLSSYQDIVSISAEANYVLLLDSNLNVSVVSSDDVDRSIIDEWQSIVGIEAQQSAAYALSKTGYVYQFGDAIESSALSEWSGIFAISASDTHIVGIQSGGTVTALGDNTYGQCDTSSWTNVKIVAAGDTFTAGVKEDGTVVIAGTLTNSSSVSEWSNVVAISASSDYLIGLAKDGTVYAAGNNDYGQCDVSDLIDIVAISASSSYGAFVREDGVVQYVGNAQYNPIISTLEDNLIYDNYVVTTGIKIGLSQETYYVDDILQLSASLNPSNATYQRILYYSSNTDVATIDSSGNIAIVGVGTVTFTAVANTTGYSTQITISCQERVYLESMAFSDEVRSVIVGESIQLSLIFTPTNATVTGNITYTPTSSNYISIDENGVITGLSAMISGTAIAVTATLVEDGVTYTASCSIIVKSNVYNVVWDTLPTKTEYLYGESLDLSGGKIEITTYNTVLYTSTVENIDASMVSGFDSKVIGEQTITITYVNFILTYTVTVSDYILNIAIKDSSLLTTSFDIGSTFSLGNGAFVAIYASGASVLLSSDDLVISHTGTTFDTLGSQTVSVAYTPQDITYSLTYQIVVNDKVKSIDAQAVVGVYQYLQELSLDTKVILELISGGTSEITLGDCLVSGYEYDVLGYQIITVTYVDASGQQFTSDQQVQVVYSGSISIINNDTGKTATESMVTYYSGETPLISVSLTSNGQTIEVPIYNANEEQMVYYKLSGISDSASYNEPYYASVELYIKSTSGSSYSYSKQEPSVQIIVSLDRKPEKIEIYSAQSVVYLNQTPTIPTIKLTYDTGDVAYVSASSVTMDTSILGEQTAYAKYMGETYEYSVVIIDYVIGIVEIDDIVVELEDEINIEVVVLYASGSSRTLSLQEYSISQIDKSLLGIAQILTVEFTDGMGSHSTSFTLTIYDTVDSIVISQSFKTEYLYGEEFDYSCSFYVTYNSGGSETLAYDEDVFSFAFGSTVFDGSTKFNSSVLGTQTLYILYIPAQIVLDVVVITISDYVADIIPTLSETSYKYGQDLSIALKVYWATGSVTTVTDFTTNYSATTTGEQEIYVTYNGVSVYAGAVTVIDAMLSATLSGTGRTYFYYGEAFSYIGRELVLVYESGNQVTLKDNEMSDYLTSNYDATKVGTNQVIILLSSSLTMAENSVAFFAEITIEVKAQTAQYMLGIAEGNSAYIDDSYDAIVFDYSVTASSIVDAITIPSYLTIVLECNGTQVEGDYVLPTGTIVKAVNASGTTIYQYSIIVIGDVNGDASIDSEDVIDMALTYLAGGDKYSTLLDLNGDGIFSLTDLILWAEKVSSPDNVPSQELAEELVTYIKEESEYEYA